MSSNEDRSWMYERLSESGLLNQHFVNGVQMFMEFAFSQSHLLNGSRSKCPCKRCGNRNYLEYEEIRGHLYRYGFMNQYHVWALHGERSNYTSPPSRLEQSTAENAGERYRNMLDDAFGGQFENVNFNDPREEPPNSEAKAFFDLLEASNISLNIEGGTTVLEFISTFLSNKVENAGTDKYSNAFLKQVHDQLLSPAERLIVPDTLYNMKKLMKGLGLGYRTFDVCVNNCMLYYGEKEGETKCEQCEEERFKENHNPKARKRISRKKLWYLPLTPRLQRLYMSRSTSEHMTWHLKCTGDNDRMIHPAAGEAWKSFDRKYPDYAAEARNVRLGICTDGFTPYGSSSVPYSCWPVFVTPYNLPPDMCMKQEYIFLSMVISGPKSPGKNLDVLLRPLIDELKELWVTGVETYDSFRKQNFVMRASLLWTISDYPAYGMLSQWSTHGRLSCPYCMEDTLAFQLKHGRKISFFDCHRRFLPPDHPWRNNTRDFFKGRKETHEPLLRRSGKEMKRHVKNLPEIPFGNTGHYIQGFGEKHNWCRRSIFWELPYWKTLLIRHNLDVMHCEKNFFDNIKNTVMDDPDKMKDKVTARRDLELYTRRKDLFLKTGRDNKEYKPKAVYCLSREQKKLVCEWLNEVQFPDGYASNISRCVQIQQLRLTGMKSHYCHVFMQRLVPIAFRDLLPDHVWGPLVEVSNFFRALCAAEIRKSDMESLEKTIVETMCKLEKIFPPSFFDSMEHLAIHLPWEAKVGGPVQYRWMYPFERRMYGLKRSAKNKAHVEGSICEVYVMSEIAYYTSYYFGAEIQTIHNQLNRNEIEMSVGMNAHLFVFQKKGKPIGSSVLRRLTTQEYNAAHWYVISNTREADCWMRLFHDEVGYNLDGQQRNAYFVKWFKERVNSGVYQVDPRVYTMAQGPLYKARSYDGYIINGFRFHTKSFSIGKETMNSGVCVKASTGDRDEIVYYGMLQEVLELEYWGNDGAQTLALFKCDWYDITRGTNIHKRYGLVDINPNMRLSTGSSEPFILASQAQQVYYTKYPSRSRSSWWVVNSTRARHIVDTSAVGTSSASATEPTDIYQDNEPLLIPALVDENPNIPVQLADPVFELVESEDEELYGDEDEDEDLNSDD